MWNTNSTQLLEPNRNNLKQTSKIKTEPNRTEKNLNRGSPSQSQTEINSLSASTKREAIILYLLICTQMFPACVSTNHMEVILPCITEKCPLH